MASYATFADVPTGERNVLMDFRNRWEALIGYQSQVSDQEMLNIVNSGWDSTSLHGFSDAMKAAVPANMPWARYGLTSDQYASLSSTFGTEFQKLTGQAIDQPNLAKAFTAQQDVTGGFLSGSQYASQLQQDKNIQDTYGWVKYGLDYNQFQQHKQSMTQAFGGAPSDPQAVQALQYWHVNQAASQAVQAQPASQAKNAPVTPGTAQSVIR